MSSDDSPPPAANPVTLPAGTRLSDTYEIESHIALGGMAEVYRARNVHTDEPVAIKLVLPEFARDETILALFKKEATILSRLRHDAIVNYQLFTIEKEMKRPYLVMEYVDGVPLSEQLKEGAIAPAEVRRLLLRIASGLEAAHGVGVVHRDLSPDNVILPDGRMERAKIIDFGIAKAAAIGDGTLLGGKFAGKYNFVSPEQLGLYGGEVNEQSDVYSLGLVGAAASLGQPLDMSGSHAEVLDKRRTVPDLGEIEPGLRATLSAMLEPRPEDRLRDMGAVISMLNAPPPANAKTVVQASVPASDPWASTEPAPVPVRESRPPAPKTMVPAAAARSDQATPLFDPLHPVAQTSESPFGPAVESTPLEPPRKTAAPARARAQRSSPLIFAVPILLLIVAGGGAVAYMQGWADQLFASGAATPPVPEPSVVEDEIVEPAGVESEPSVPAGESQTTEPLVPAPDGEVAPDTGPSLPAEQVALPTEGELTERPVEESVPEQPAAEPLDTEPAPAAEDVDTGPTPGVPVEETTVIADIPDNTPPPVDDTARRVAWVNNYDLGPCQYATAVSISEMSMAIEAFGNSVAPFERLDTEFAQLHGFAPDIGLRLISDSQCAVADFLKDAKTFTAPGPILLLNSDIVASGVPLRGVLQDTSGWTTELFLIDDAGEVRDVTGFLSASGTTSLFELTMTSDAQQAVPMILVAISSPAGLALATSGDQENAATFFPEILRKLSRTSSEVAVTAQYFKLRGS